MTVDKRELRDLVSIGPAMLRGFELLGVRSVSQLATRNPEKLYEQLCQITGQSAGHLLS
jgi:Pathogenicity locus